LLNLCTILCNEPLLNEPGIRQSNPDVVKYTHLVRYMNLKIAVCDIMTKRVSMPFFKLFDKQIDELFRQNYNKMVDVVETLMQDADMAAVFPEYPDISTRIYPRCSVRVDRVLLLDTLRVIHESLDFADESVDT